MKTFTILPALLAAVSATPFGLYKRDPDLCPFEKQDTEIVYLANCVSAVSCCTPPQHYSQIIVRFPPKCKLVEPKTDQIIVLSSERPVAEWRCSTKHQRMHHVWQWEHHMGRCCSTMQVPNWHDFHLEHCQWRAKSGCLCIRWVRSTRPMI